VLFPLWGAVSLSMRIIGIKEGRNQKNDMRKRNTGQRTENGRQRTEDGGQKTEVGGQKTEVGGQKTEGTGARYPPSTGLGAKLNDGK